MNRIDVIGQNGNDGEHYDKIDKILDEREKTHGKYADVAELDFELSALLGDALSQMIPTDALAIKMILHKIARISCGDPLFSDHWDDIAGYAARAIEYRECFCVEPRSIRYNSFSKIPVKNMLFCKSTELYLAISDISDSIYLICTDYDLHDAVEDALNSIVKTATEYSTKHCNNKKQSSAASGKE